ncbi:MAG: hypothetical protein IPF53_23050 [Blastocatellia bacterium]|nr:hypothetical protein [Blastocatellia bacterium]
MIVSLSIGWSAKRHVYDAVDDVGTEDFFVAAIRADGGDDLGAGEAAADGSQGRAV